MDTQWKSCGGGGGGYEFTINVQSEYRGVGDEVFVIILFYVRGG